MLTCGIEINQTNIRYVVLESKRNSCVAINHGRVQLDDDQSPVEVMIQLRENGKIPNRVRIASGIDMSQLRSLSLPPMPKREMELAIQQEIDREQEMVDEDLASGYQVLGREPGGRRRILVAQTPRRNIEILEAQLTRASFETEVLTTSSVALLSYGIAELGAAEEKAIAVVHLGDQRMLLAVLDHGQIRFIRDLGLGLDASLLATLETQATGTDDTAVIDDEIDFDQLENLTRGLDEINKVAGQIRRTLEYDAQQSPDVPVARVLLAGDVTRAEAMVPLISNEISLPTELLDPSNELGLTDDSCFDGEGPSYALPFALAKPRQAKVLLHLGQRPRATTRDPLLLVAVVSMALGILAMVFSFGFNSEIEKLKSSRSDLKDDIAVLENQIGIGSDDGDFGHRARALRTLFENPSPLDVLSWTANHIPERESVEQLTLQRSGTEWQAELSGTFRRSNRESRVKGWSHLLRRLEREPRVFDLRIPAVNGVSHTPDIPVSFEFTWESK